MKRFLLSTLLLALILAMTARSAQPSLRRIDIPSISFSASAAFQDHTTERRAGSIAGRITVGGKSAPGVAVMLLRLDSSSSRRTPVANVKTDEEGRYQFKGVAPGSYDVFPAAPVLVLPKQGRYGQPGKTVMVEVGEATEGIDFALTEGGVITGRVIDADGRPVVEEAVSLKKTAEQGYMPQFIPPNYESLTTDDRGVYRVYGVPAGHYLVSVGAPYGVVRTGGNRREYYKETFHPGVTDRAKAVSVEVKEGAETTGVDITVGRPQKTYAMMGRVVNAEYRPLSGIELGVTAHSEDGNSSTHTSSGWRSDDKGAFRIEGALPGHYLIYPKNDPSSNSFGEPISFDVKNADVSDLEIKMSRGASISGVVVVEGVNDPAMKDKLSQLGVSTHVRLQDSSTTLRDRVPYGFTSSRISGDGSFRVAGIRPGKAMIQLTPYSPSAPKEFVILRVERNGQEINNGIEIGPGEQITGVRVVIGAGSGVIRGQVKIEGGQLEGVLLSIYVRRASGDPHSYSRSIEPDTHGRFVIEKLVEGDYELLIGPMSVTVTGDAGGKTMSRMPTVKQTVSVNPGAVSEVTLVLSLRP